MPQTINAQSFSITIDFVAPIIGKTVLDLVTKGYIPKELAKGRKVNGKTQWTILLEKNLTLPAPFKNSINTPKVSITNTGGAAPMSDTQKEAVDRVMDCGSDKLWALATRSKETDNL